MKFLKFSYDSFSAFLISAFNGQSKCLRSPKRKAPKRKAKIEKQMTFLSGLKSKTISKLSSLLRKKRFNNELRRISNYDFHSNAIFPSPSEAAFDGSERAVQHTGPRENDRGRSEWIIIPSFWKVASKTRWAHKLEWRKTNQLQKHRAIINHRVVFTNSSERIVVLGMCKFGGVV